MKLRLIFLTALCAAAVAHAQDLDARTKADIDAEVQRVLTQTGVPSASVGVARNGKIVYTAAFGKASITPSVPATPEMIYPIGSVSKQFTAACILMLVEEGKLSLEDPVSRWFPDYTNAAHVTVRNLLTHTSGYSDYAPQDYTIPAWTKPVDHTTLIHEWATKPLDFAPGTRWQYSNTNFAIAGMIIEKASGEPFWDFVTRRILKPLNMQHAIDLNLTRKELQVTGYMGNALGPPRLTTLEAPGWFFADGEMGMPVADLLRWDVAVAARNSILKPASWDLLETEMKLKDGSGTQYGLGIHVESDGGHRVLAHGGEVGGYVSQNVVYPDDSLAIAVLTNEENSSAAENIASSITSILLPSATSAARVIKKENPEGAAKAEAQARSILAGLMQRKIDRKLFTADANDYFNEQTIADFATSLGPLGPITELTNTRMMHRGGMTFRIFTLKYATESLELTTYIEPDGNLEQFLVSPE